VTDREVIPGCARVRTKCAEKTSVGLWGQSRDLRELPGVTGPSHGVVGVLHLVSELTLAVTWACVGQGRGHGVHHGTCAGTGCTDVSKRGNSWTGVDRRGRRTSWPGLNRIDRILISTRYTFFSGSSSEKNSRLSVLGLEQFEDG
jgi:hypothetical protein